MTLNPSGEQLPLPFSHTEHSLRHLLAEGVGRPLSMVLTENSTILLSARLKEGILCIRLHRMFLNADSRVFAEIVSYLKKRSGSMPHFHVFVRHNRHELRRKPPNQVTVRTRGRSHNLRELYDEINKDYFDGAVRAAITWGSGSRRRAARSRTVGSYSERSDTIRINPVLDRMTVPRWYLAFIVYHEMLHAFLGTPMRGKKRCIHSFEFRRREKLFKEYERAMAWEAGR
jgi:hypothetical protein